MNNEFRDAILLVLDLLKKNGQSVDVLASAAAYSADTPGATELLNVLLREAGPDVFVSRDKGGKFQSDAFERAAAGNQVGAMKWMLESGAIEKPYFKVESHTFGKPVLEFPAAVAAAHGGAFNALEFLAEKVPEMIALPFQSSVTAAPLLDLNLSYRHNNYKSSNTDFVGLMVVAIAVAKDKGVNVTSMVDRFAEHLKSGVEFSLPAMTMAIELGAAECVSAMLEAGGRIRIESLGDNLNASGRPTSVLRAIKDHAVQTHKDFEAMFTQDDSMTPYIYAKFRKFPANLSSLLTDMVEVQNNAARYRFPYARHNGLPFSEFEPKEVAQQLVAFLKHLVPEALSPALLARAVGYDCKELASLLLDEGIDPNAVPDLPESDSDEVPPLARNYAAVQRCKSPEMIRLLHERGANVNLQGAIHPAASGRPSHQGNLLTAVMMNKNIPRIPDMIHEFVRCGGDLGATFGERKLAYYLNNHPAEIKALVKSIKTEVAVAGAVGDNSGPANSASQGSRKQTASPL